MATQDERRRATRRRILDAARASFIGHGIEGTSTDAVRAAAGVSRGAMYHHFSSRNDLVAAVYEEVSAAAITRAVERVPVCSAALERLIVGCLAWLEEASRPDVARILLEDGPAALGWQRCQQIEERHSLGQLSANLQAAVDAGEIQVRSVELAARMLNAMLGQAVLALFHAADPDRARDEAEATIRALLAGLATAAAEPDRAS